MLHESSRMLKPGGRLLAVDPLDSELTRRLHIGDVFTPMPPETLGSRLAAAGFHDITIENTGHQIRFAARKNR